MLVLIAIPAGFAHLAAAPDARAASAWSGGTLRAEDP